MGPPDILPAPGLAPRHNEERDEGANSCGVKSHLSIPLNLQNPPRGDDLWENIKMEEKRCLFRCYAPLLLRNKFNRAGLGCLSLMF